MKKWLEEGRRSLSALAEGASDVLSSGFTMIQEKVNDLPIFVSMEKQPATEDLLYDEKHYFVVPYVPSPYKFALHSTRCLPDTYGEINDLPKRRVFHFAHPSAEKALRAYMLESAKEIASERKASNPSSLEALADDIDALDSKLTFGMLLVGGVAAIFNPLVGSAIAAKALLPSMSGLVSKYGVRPAGEKLTERQLKSDVKAAEEKVLQEFSDASTLCVINPVLQELDFALRTTEEQHDPLLDPNLAEGSIPELPHSNWRLLTETAVCHVYQEVYETPSMHGSANLGPEDIRWLKTLFDAQEK